MKRTTLTSLFVAGALLFAAPSWAQSPKADSMLLSEQTEGDYRVRRYRVEQPAEADYTLHYRINLAMLDPKLGENPAELQQMEHFFTTLKSDTLHTVKLISITGYASPDGPEALNERLSKARTTHFQSYGDKHYHLTDHYPLTTSSVAEDWSAVRSAVAQSSMPDRERVLQILDSSASHTQKEAELKALPAAWDYLKSTILPPLRRVEVVVNYARGSIVEQRTLIAAPLPAPREVAEAKPAPKSAADPCDPCACPMVDEEITGLIVAYPEHLQHPDRHADHEKLRIRIREKGPHHHYDKAYDKAHRKASKHASGHHKADRKPLKESRR